LSLKLSNIHFVLLAAGKSTRFRSKKNKLLSKFSNKTILEHNIEQIKKIGFKKITLVVNDKKIIRNINTTCIELIKGGKTRSESVKNALNNSKIKAKYVFIHDAARVLNSDTLLLKLINNTNKNIYDCIIPYAKCNDTVVQNHKNIKREDLKLIKTPQVFLKKKITLLLNKSNSLEFTDDSKLMRDNPKEFKIKYILDNSLNLKITHKEDLEQLNINFKRTIRVGLGYDIHRIQKIDKFNFIRLGGIKIKSKVSVYLILMEMLFYMPLQIPY
jgi:2-C-methyl-D-erythritol 4-phosphate cytidylyltransferase/2-C-methyl-D-erythritol 2,4-cyclodiphosphate synthase